MLYVACFRTVASFAAIHVQEQVPHCLHIMVVSHVKPIHASNIIQSEAVLETVELEVRTSLYTVAPLLSESPALYGSAKPRVYVQLLNIYLRNGYLDKDKYNIIA